MIIGGKSYDKYHPTHMPELPKEIFREILSFQFHRGKKHPIAELFHRGGWEQAFHIRYEAFCLPRLICYPYSVLGKSAYLYFLDSHRAQISPAMRRDIVLTAKSGGAAWHGLSSEQYAIYTLLAATDTLSYTQKRDAAYFAYDMHTRRLPHHCWEFQYI